MSRLIRNKKLIGSTSNDSSHIIYDPSDTSRSETTVKSELDRLNAGIPAVDVGNAVTDWTNTETATSTAQGSDNYTTLNDMTPSSSIKSLLTSIKSLLFGLSTQVTSMNTDLSSLTNVKVANFVQPTTAVNGARAVPNTLVPRNADVIGISGAPAYDYFEHYKDSAGNIVVVQYEAAGDTRDTTGGINVNIYYVER